MTDIGIRYQPRWLRCVVFLLALATLARNRPRVFSALLLIVLADLGLTTFQHPYLPAGAVKAAVPMPDDELENLRTFELTFRREFKIHTATSPTLTRAKVRGVKCNA